jgi:hypothetical protein
MQQRDVSGGMNPDLLIIFNSGAANYSIWWTKFHPQFWSTQFNTAGGDVSGNIRFVNPGYFQLNSNSPYNYSGRIYYYASFEYFSGGMSKMWSAGVKCCESSQDEQGCPTPFLIDYLWISTPGYKPVHSISGYWPYYCFLMANGGGPTLTVERDMLWSTWDAYTISSDAVVDWTGFKLSG